MQRVRPFSHTWSTKVLAAVIAGQVWALDAVAQLPTQVDPDSGTVRDGNILDAVRFYATVIFILVTTNAIAVYKEIRDGRRTWGDLGMHAGAGAVLIVFVVFLLTQAQDIIN